MKNIIEYVKQSIDRNKFIESACRRRHKFSEWKQMYEDFVGESIEDNGQELYDFTLESLISHNTSDFIKAINKKYPDIDTSKFNEKTKDKFIVMCNDKNQKQLDELKNDKNLLDFFNYFVAYDYNHNNERIFVLEPTYPEDANKLVEKSHLKLYHICSKSYTDSILKNGLRCRGLKLSDNSYSAFPSRIYCLAIPYKYGSEKFNDELNKFLEETGFTKFFVNILEIDLNDRHHDSWVQKFYIDGRMDHKYAVFTYHNIPKNYIRKIDFPK